MQENVTMRVFSIVFFVFLGIFLGQDVDAQASSKSDNGYTINGTVIVEMPFNVDKYLDAIEHASPKSQKDIVQTIRKLSATFPQNQHAKNVLVRLKGETVEKTASTDNKGCFSFTGLPAGKYTVTAEIPSCPTGIAGTPQTIHFNSKVKIAERVSVILLSYSPLSVVVRGRLIDTFGKPVVGVITLTGIPHPTESQWGDREPPTWSTSSNADGSFEIQGVAPSTWLIMAGALVPKGRIPDGAVSIQVAAKGYVVTDSKKLHDIVMASEDVLYLARRFLAIMNQVALAQGKPAYKEATNLPLPKSVGNVIMLDDIVLKPVESH